ncbi:MAG: hypothetical protein ACYC6N_15450 [Pirellulaceae bacterium]
MLENAVGCRKRNLEKPGMRGMWEYRAAPLRRTGKAGRSVRVVASGGVDRTGAGPWAA